MEREVRKPVVHRISSKRSQLSIIEEYLLGPYTGTSHSCSVNAFPRRTAVRLDSKPIDRAEYWGLKGLDTNSIIPWRFTLTGVLDIGVPSSLGRWPPTCLRKSSTWSSVGFSTSPPIPSHVSHRTSTIVLGPFRRFSMMGYVVRAWRVLAVSFRRMGRRYRPIRRLISVVFAMFCRPTMTKCGISNDFRRVSLLIMDWIKSNTLPNSLLLPYLDTGDSISLDISKLNSGLENK